MYMMGENPFLSDPNINKVRKALSRAGLPGRPGHLPDRDRRVRRRHPAGVVLPGEGRHLHQHRPPGAARPQGARPAGAGAGGLGGRPGHRQPDRARLELRQSPREVFEEIVSVMPQLHATSATTTSAPTGKLYPNPDPEHSDGTVVMFGERFNTDDGLAHLVPAEWLPAKELPDERVPVRAQHRPAAGALAHRLDDPPVLRAGRHRAAGRGLPPPRRRRRAGRRRRRDGAGDARGAGDRAARRGCRTARRAATASSRSTSARRRPTC